MEDPRFSDDEVQEILRRAIDEKASERLPGSGGVSLTELKAIASEVGIDPTRVESAAHAVARERRSVPASRLLGAPRVLDVEHTVRGQLTPDAFPELLKTIRRVLGHKGDATEIQGSLQWGSESESGVRYVTVATKGETTTIHASSNLSSLATITFLPPGLLGTIISIIAFTQAAEAANEVGMVLCLLLIPTLFVVLRTIFGRLVAAEADKLHRVVHEIAESIRATEK